MAYKIVLDAGHGGTDPGAIYKERKEKDDNLELTRAVGKILEDNGIDVVYTRTTNVYQTPFEKARIANEVGADYFISFHRNSSPKENQYSDTLMDIYGFEASEGFISDVTDKILPQIEDWQNRPLEEVYPVVYIDAIHYSVREDGVIRKLAAYVILGLTLEGKKEVLSIQIGENESSKYWLCVLNELKNRGVKDILILCSDGLTGIKEAITAAFPKTEQQRCIVHMVRNTLKYVSDKDRKAFATDLKTIYHAANEEKALEALEKVTEKWTPKYPNSMKRWHDNWDVVSPIFKFSMEVRKVIYTTNAIESLNSTYRKLNRQRSVFPGSTALLKALYLATFEATKKWTMPIRNWGQVYGELSIMYEGRLPE